MTWRKQIRTAWAAAAAAALALPATILVAAEKAPFSLEGAASRVSVAGTGNGAYRIEGSFRVDAPQPVVWALLTDKDSLSSIV